MLEKVVRLAESLDFIDRLIDSFGKICDIIEGNEGFMGHFHKGTGNGLYNRLVFKLAVSYFSNWNENPSVLLTHFNKYFKLNDQLFPLSHIVSIFDVYLKQIKTVILPRLGDRDKKKIEELVELVKPIKLMPEECEDAEIITLWASMSRFLPNSELQI